MRVLAKEQGGYLAMHYTGCNFLSPSEQSLRQLTFITKNIVYLGSITAITECHLGKRKPGMTISKMVDAVGQTLSDLDDYGADVGPIVLENCEMYDPLEVSTICQAINVPMVYDMEHHLRHHKLRVGELRTPVDAKGIQQAVELAALTWGDRTPLFHLASSNDSGEHRSQIDWHDYDNLRSAIHRAGLGSNFIINLEGSGFEQNVIDLTNRTSMNRPVWAVKLDRGVYV